MIDMESKIEERKDSWPEVIIGFVLVVTLVLLLTGRLG